MEAKCTIVANDWDGMIPGLQASKFDAVIASMAITEEREKQVAFTERYYTTPLAVVVPKDSDITSLDPSAFDGKTVGAQAGTTQGNYADDVYSKAGADVKLYPTADEANADLESGRLDAIAADKFLAADWLKSRAPTAASSSAIFRVPKRRSRLPFAKGPTICAISSTRLSKRSVTTAPTKRSAKSISISTSIDAKISSGALLMSGASGASVSKHTRGGALSQIDKAPII
jgi:hypothetical protein